MNAQQVANTLWALSRLRLQPEAAHACLLQQVPRVADDLSVIGLQQVRCSLEWMQQQAYSGEDMAAALHSVNVGSV
jgi:hypothetical protein